MIPNENVRVSEHAKTEVTVRPKREDRTLERDRFYTVIRQRFDHPRKFVEQRAVSLTRLVRIRAEGISYFFGHQVRRNTIQGAPGQRGQPVLHRRAREKRPVDAVDQHLPDRGLVRLTWPDPGASQQEPELTPH